MPGPMAAGQRLAAAELAEQAAAVPDVAAADVVQVVRRAAQGEEHAWERLVELSAPLIWATIREFRLNESDATDVAQATWLCLLEHIDRLELSGRVGSWLATTTHSQCLYTLSAARRPSSPERGDPEG